ncbi:hypothetical protein BGW36DRAFT_460050 [Talaromyces proteolyticus]|uniref:Uncharacterized protein n=1 Tax=Talaromyces proteolyticus TaxID=1131652 RepID=A0AAD4L148_9EURO|nr:uncharacterized protein BGW36DRAFT_460050 [Talaromyces proteolyticus]KAH8700979.1 hypothetical protein BGW36DRAFT_460050 [Talaromyces proteolyticus]
MNRQNNSESLIVEPGGRIITSTERHMEIPSHSQQHLHDGDQLQRRHQVTRADYTLVEKAILKSFCFEGIHDRHESIVTAHENTFAWIFEDPAIHNRPWDSFNPMLKEQLFRQILATIAIDVDFFFFIDGLDEFDGDHTEIADFFNELSLIPKASVDSLQALGKELASIYLKIGHVEERNLEIKSLT